MKVSYSLEIKLRDSVSITDTFKRLFVQRQNNKAVYEFPIDINPPNNDDAARFGQILNKNKEVT